MVFQKMMLANEKPNSITLVSLLSACTHMLNIGAGESIHSYIIVNCIELDVALGTAIVEMYSKCGHIEKALKVFNSLTDKNLQSWTIMISGLAYNGHGENAISLFTQMEQIGLQPDSMSFSGILSACSHLGLVGEGQVFFNRMVKIYNIRPTMEHYGCMVDMFARAGMIEEAYEIMKNMPMEPNSVILRSFIGACRNHDRVFGFNENLRRLLLEMEPEIGANYILASGVSSLFGCWNEAADLRVSMKEKGLKKVSGWSRVEVSRSHREKILQEAVR